MKIQMNADASKKGTKFAHHWSKCVGAGRANEGLRADWQSHLKLAAESCGFEYVRFHGLFHDDMFVLRHENGKDIYNFQYTDALFDAMLDLGLRPFVEFGFMPSCLASSHDTQFWWKGNITPPNDFAKWGELTHRSVSHWIERYGIDEVVKWYFEVWNEANLRAFWSGTKSEYFRLYEVTARVIKSINENLRVGGPATSNFVPDARFDGEKEDFSKQMTFKDEDIDSAQWKGVWIEEFLDFCAEKNLPVDFVSAHPYPTDFALDGHGINRGLTRGVNATFSDLKWLKETVAGSAYPGAEIHLTEWNSSPSPRDTSHDWLPAAAYVAKANIDCIGLADSLSYWTFTDVFEEQGAGDKAFHGGFGMINLQGIAKPTFHAYRFLHQLGDTMLDKGDGFIVTKDEASGKVASLIYNYPEDEMPLTVPISYYPDHDGAMKIQAMGQPKKISVHISGLRPNAKFIVETLDAQNGCAAALWDKMGRPSSPDRAQTAQLKAAAAATKKEPMQADEKGVLTFSGSVPVWGIMLIEETK